MSRRLLTIGAAVAALAGLAVAYAAPARLLVRNDGFQIDYGWTPIAGAAVAAIGAIALAALSRPVALRAVGALLAIGAVVLGVQRGAWQVGADRTAITARTLTETSRIAWAEVRQVHSDTEALQVVGFGDTRIAIGLAGLRPHDRATLERTISRRVQETAPAAAPTPRVDR